MAIHGPFMRHHDSIFNFISKRYNNNFDVSLNLYEI